MIPLAGVLLPGPLPGGQAQTSALPWPNGSLIPARLISMDTPETATIMIGSYRMQAKVPPNTPPGHIWLQLISRELPARLQLLSESRALEILTRTLARAHESSAPSRSEQPATRQEGGWSAPPNLPFTWQESGDGRRMFIALNDDESPRGMLQREADGHHYALHGRLDLDALGTLFFMLEQKKDGPMHLSLRAADHRAFMTLRQPFLKFLADRKPDGQPLKGRLFEGREPFIRPETRASA